MQHFWTDDGLMKTALDYIGNNCGPTSSGERGMLLLCADTV